MLFQFNLLLTDADYLDFNLFTNTKTPFGKKQIRTFRIALSVICAAMLLFILAAKDFSLKAAAYQMVAVVITLTLFQVLYLPFIRYVLKLQIKTLRKNGKMPYSASSLLEFFEDRFTESTETQRTEQFYSALEKVCVVNGKAVYAYLNNLQGYILPARFFSSYEHVQQFADFLASRGVTVLHFN